MREQPQFNPRRIIERPRLIKKLEQANAKTILLVAPAGYGKTTLLEQWSKIHPPTFWLTAGPGSHDVAQLAVDLAAALEPVCPGLVDEITQVVRAMPNPTRKARQLVDAFASRVRPDTVESAIIDDYHLVPSGSGAARFLDDFCDQLIPRRLVAARERPSWATTRGELYGEFLHIGPSDLALNAEEAADVLSDASAVFSNRLTIQARGWPAVISLAAAARTRQETPRHAMSTTLFDFFAAEIYADIGEDLQDDLLVIALLPDISHEVMTLRFGTRTRTLLETLATRGFLTLSGSQFELHPLIRDFLLAKLDERSDAHERVTNAVSLGLELSAWDSTFDLVTRFGRADLIEDLATAAFLPLMRAARINTLQELGTWARGRQAYLPVITLIDATVALRDGLLRRAEGLAVNAAQRLGEASALAAHAFWVAGHAAQLAGNNPRALSYFERSGVVAQNDHDIRNALWGSVGASIFSETWSVADAVGELQQRKHLSPTDLVLASNASLLLRRFGRGERSIDIEAAIHHLDEVADPWIRSSFIYTRSYDAVLCADYESAHAYAELVLEQTRRYHLDWAVPHAEWVLAASCLGVRDFVRAERWLMRVEHAAGERDDAHLRLNAACLRARMYLALQDPARAEAVLSIDDKAEVNRAMRAEVTVTRALVSAALGEIERARRLAEDAAILTSSIDIAVYVEGLNAIGSLDVDSADRLLGLATNLGIWDPLVTFVRTFPTLLPLIAASEAGQEQLTWLLRRSNDFDLARTAKLPIGKRPKTRRLPLSPREHDVLELICQGLSDKQIGKVLFISPRTAKVHANHALTKLGAHTRAEAAARYSVLIAEHRL